MIFEMSISEESVVRNVAMASSAALLALMMAGCGGGEKADAAAPAGQSGSSTTTDAASPSTSSFDIAAAKSKAKSANLVIGDFPAGWAAAPREADDEDDAKVGKQFADCLNVPVALFDGKDDADSVSVDSPDFNSPDKETTISSSVAIASSGRMTEYFNIMKGENVSACLNATMDAAMKAALKEEDMPDGVKFDTPKVGQLSFPTYGDESVPFRVSMSASYMGLNFDFFLDMLYIRAGDSGVFLTFEGTDKPVSIETEQQYAQLVADRLASLSSATS